ncbi:MAG: hypothetical protein AAF570_10200, partial [Bacteroidota bacterium]
AAFSKNTIAFINRQIKQELDELGIKDVGSSITPTVFHSLLEKYCPTVEGKEVLQNRVFENGAPDKNFQDVLKVLQTNSKDAFNSFDYLRKVMVESEFTMVDITLGGEDESQLTITEASVGIPFPPERPDSMFRLRFPTKHQAHDEVVLTTC